MTRILTQDFRNSLEDQFSAEFGLTFLTLGDGQLATPVRIANDVVNYVYGGNTYTRMPFSMEMVGDDANPPKGQITIQNAHRKIGLFIQSLRKPLIVQIDIFAESDFGPVAKINGVSTRTEIGTATVQYSAKNLRLRNIVGDVTQIQADLTSYDPTGEPWPAPRTTQNRAPGLYL